MVIDSQNTRMRELTASCSSLCRIRRNVIAVLTTNVKDRFAVCPLNAKRLHNRKVTKSFFLNMALGSKGHAGVSKKNVSPIQYHQHPFPNSLLQLNIITNSIVLQLLYNNLCITYGYTEMSDSANPAIGKPLHK